MRLTFHFLSSLFMSCNLIENFEEIIINEHNYLVVD